MATSNDAQQFDERAQENRLHISMSDAAEIGWFAQRGRVPLGYLGDAKKTARSFPEIDGVRYSVPGDRARIRAAGLADTMPT